MKKLIIYLITIIIASGCISSSKKIPRQNLEKGAYYRRDMIIKVNGEIFEGMGVIDSADKYDFHVEARGDLDAFILSSCNRDWVKEKAWNVRMEVKGKVFRWKKKKIDKPREVMFSYEPIEEIERNSCSIWLFGAEEKKGRHSWGYVDFRTADMILPARLECNGEVKQTKGVSVCQSREGLTQVVEFKEKMLLDSINESNPRCLLDVDEGKRFEFKIRKGDCVYRFMRVREPHLEYKLTTYGYQKILIRKAGGE